MASVLTICSLCVFQYVSVVLPMNKSLTNFRCLVMVLCAWVISIFLATGPAIQWGRYEFTSNIFNCEYYHSANRADISYNITVMLCGYLFPGVFMIFSYVSILRALHEHQSRMAVTSSISPAPVAGAPVSLETKLRMTMSIVVLTFLVCRTPFFVFLVITTKDLDYPPDFWGQLSFWAIYLQSACDPFIYAFKHPGYQDTLKDIARKFKIAITSTFRCCLSKDANEEKTKEKDNMAVRPWKSFEHSTSGYSPWYIFICTRLSKRLVAECWDISAPTCTFDTFKRGAGILRAVQASLATRNTFVYHKKIY